MVDDAVTGGPPDLGLAVARMWALYAPAAVARVAVLRTYAGRLAAGTAGTQDRSAAAWAAHQLAGSLTTFGRPGSAEAAAVEVLLDGRGPVTAEDLQPYLSRLEQAVDHDGGDQ